MYIILFYIDRIFDIYVPTYYFWLSKKNNTENICSILIYSDMHQFQLKFIIIPELYMFTHIGFSFQRASK